MSTTRKRRVAAVCMPEGQLTDTSIGSRRNKAPRPSLTALSSPCGKHAAAVDAPAAAAEASEASPSEELGYHPGITCDRSGQCPIRGNRYMLSDEDYDVCEAEYLKMGEEERAKYTKVPPPCREEASDVPSPNGEDGAAAHEPPPSGWAWPREGTWIEVEVLLEGSDAAEWVAAQVKYMCVDGRFQAAVGGPEPFEDWFAWHEEGTVKKHCSADWADWGRRAQ